MLFDSERAGDRHVFRMNIDDGSISQVTSGELVGQQGASLLPDGRFAHEMYSCSVAQDLGLQVTTADGGSTVELTAARPVDDLGYDQQPDVSADGKWVTFLRMVDDTNGAAFVVSTDGGDARRLTPDLPNLGRPRWAPDGTQIFYDQNGKLWTVAAEGGDPQVLLSEAVGLAFEADWSPDGSQIVFKHYE